MPFVICIGKAGKTSWGRKTFQCFLVPIVHSRQGGRVSQGLATKKVFLFSLGSASCAHWMTGPFFRRIPIPTNYFFPCVVSRQLTGSSMFTGDAIPKSMKLKLKGGAYVDPESGLEDKAHVLKRKEEELFSVVLNAVNVQKGMNSYYKLQVLEHDKKPKCDHSKHLYIFGHFFYGEFIVSKVVRVPLLGSRRHDDRRDQAGELRGEGGGHAGLQGPVRGKDRQRVC